jgi:hypothetical protein
MIGAPPFPLRYCGKGGVQHYFCGLLDFFQKIWAQCLYYFVIIERRT